MAELRISTDKICALVEALHELEGIDFGTEIETEEGEGDESALTTIEDSEDDPRPQQIREMIRGLSDDERIDLVALALVGREDYALAEWKEATKAAAEQIEEGDRSFVDAFLAGDMASPEYLEAGLQLFGRSCADCDAETIDVSQALGESAGGEVGDIADAAQAQRPGAPSNLDPHITTKRRP
jgi:hypothetical protein